MNGNVNITVYNSKAAQLAAERAEIAAKKTELATDNLIDPPLPGTSANPAVIPAGPVDRKGKFEPEPGFYQGFPEVTAHKRWYFYWDLTNWNLKDMGALPSAPTNNQTVMGKNLVNPSRKVDGRFISTTPNNGIQVGTGWAIMIVPIGASQDFAISGWNTIRAEIAFYKGTVPNPGAFPPISDIISSGSAVSQGLSKSAGVCKGKTPALTTVMVITILHTSETPVVYENLQVELGTEVTSFVPYGEEVVVKGINDKEIVPSKLVINGQIVPTSSLQLKDSGSGVASPEFTFDNSLIGIYSTMEFSFSGRLIKHQFKSKRTTSLDVANTFDWNLFQVNGITKHSQADENAPFRIAGWTVGGNHGYRRYNITLATHGKTASDIGSVWTDGSNQWVIVGIPDINTIAVSHRIDNITTLTANILNHVSGATNSTSINSSTKVSIDFYPPNKNYSLKVLVDGAEVTTASIVKGKDKLTFIESYEIISKESMMDWFVANVGSVTVPTKPDGTSIAKITNMYSFDMQMGCYTSQNFTALNEVDLPFQDIMFLMANKLSVAYKVYVPKTLPFTQSGDNYDFRTPLAYTTPTAYRINFNVPATVEPKGILADRALHIGTSENLGFAIGFLPLDDANKSRRRELVTNKAMQFNESGKIYLSAVDSSGITTMKKGNSYNVQGYKAYFFKGGNRTANYIVNSPQGKYYYFDWHTAGADSISLPDSFEIIEKSANVSLLSKSKVFVNIDLASPYGYLIVKG